MVVRLVGERPDGGPLVGAAGEQRQVFADAEAGGAGRDGAELAADRVGGVRLRVEALVLGQPAGQEDVDHRFGERGA